MTLSSFGTLFLDHNVSQLFVMSQLTIVESNSLLNIILKEKCSRNVECRSVGFIDGAHIRLHSAPDGDKDYTNMKGDHSIQVSFVTGCYLGSDKFWLLGRNSLRWAGTYAAFKLLTSVWCLLVIICDKICCVADINAYIPSILIVYHTVSIYDYGLIYIDLLSILL